MRGLGPSAGQQGGTGVDQAAIRVRTAFCRRSRTHAEPITWESFARPGTHDMMDSLKIRDDPDDQRCSSCDSSWDSHQSYGAAEESDGEFIDAPTVNSRCSSGLSSSTSMCSASVSSPVEADLQFNGKDGLASDPLSDDGDGLSSASQLSSPARHLYPPRPRRPPVLLPKLRRHSVGPTIHAKQGASSDIEAMHAAIEAALAWSPTLLMGNNESDGDKLETQSGRDTVTDAETRTTCGELRAQPLLTRRAVSTGTIVRPLRGRRRKDDGRRPSSLDTAENTPPSNTPEHQARLSMEGLEEDRGNGSGDSKGRENSTTSRAHATTISPATSLERLSEGERNETTTKKQATISSDEVSKTVKFKSGERVLILDVCESPAASPSLWSISTVPLEHVTEGNKSSPSRYSSEAGARRIAPRPARTCAPLLKDISSEHSRDTADLSHDDSDGEHCHAVRVGVARYGTYENGCPDRDIDNGHRSLPLSSLVGVGRQWPAGVDPARREEWLSPKGFYNTFGMSFAEFQVLPRWRRVLAKRKIGLF